MKILHIITGLGDGGAESVLTRLCLHSHVAEHIVISLIDEGKYGQLLRDKGIEVHCLGMNPGKPSATKFFKLISLIRDIHPDVVQTWMYHADLLGGIAAKLVGVKSVFWNIRHTTLVKGKSKRSTILIAKTCAKLSAWVPKKIVYCAQEARVIHESLGYNVDKAQVIPNGYDLSKFCVSFKARADLRLTLNIPNNIFLVGMVGRYNPQKDHASLIKALCLMKKTGFVFKVVLVGRDINAQNETLLKSIVENKLEDEIMLLGQQSDIPAIMNALDLHVLSSSFGEAFPNVVAEAMACGTPCISTNVGDALEIIGDPELTCPAQDPIALSQLIQTMHQQWAGQPKEWKQLKINCVQRITERFSIKSMVEAYEDCWFDNQN